MLGIKIIVTYVIIAIVSFTIAFGGCIKALSRDMNRDRNNKSEKSIESDSDCPGGVCPPPEEYREGDSNAENK